MSDLYSLDNWDLMVCSRNSWDPICLPIQVPTSFLPSLPSHQKIHTHANIFSPFDVYFNHSIQFTMLVWESVFSWLAISKKADLWRHNCKLSDLFFSVTVCPAYTSPGSLILQWLSLPSLLILPPSLTLNHILVPFSSLIQFLTWQQQKKQFDFLVFFAFFNRVAYDRIFFLKVPFRGLLTLIVIFHALKDKRRVLVWGNGITSELGGRLHEKECGLMRAFGRQGQCRGLGQQSQLKTWGA